MDQLDTQCKNLQDKSDSDQNRSDFDAALIQRKHNQAGNFHKSSRSHKNTENDHIYRQVIIFAAK